MYRTRKRSGPPPEDDDDAVILSPELAEQLRKTCYDKDQRNRKKRKYASSSRDSRGGREWSLHEHTVKIIPECYEREEFTVTIPPVKVLYIDVPLHLTFVFFRRRPGSASSTLPRSDLERVHLLKQSLTDSQYGSNEDNFGFMKTMYLAFQKVFLLLKHWARMGLYYPDIPRTSFVKYHTSNPNSGKYMVSFEVYKLVYGFLVCGGRARYLDFEKEAYVKHVHPKILQAFGEEDFTPVNPYVKYAFGQTSATVPTPVAQQPERPTVIDINDNDPIHDPDTPERQSEPPERQSEQPDRQSDSSDRHSDPDYEAGKDDEESPNSSQTSNDGEIPSEGQDISDMWHTMSTLQQQIIDIRKENAKSAATVTSLQTEVEELRTQYSDLHDSHHLLLTKYDELSEQWNTMNGNFKKIRDSHESLLVSHETLSDNVDRQSREWTQGMREQREQPCNAIHEQPYNAIHEQPCNALTTLNTPRSIHSADSTVYFSDAHTTNVEKVAAILIKLAEVVPPQYWGAGKLGEIVQQFNMYGDDLANVSRYVEKNFTRTRFQNIIRLIAIFGKPGCTNMIEVLKCIREICKEGAKDQASRKI